MWPEWLLQVRNKQCFLKKLTEKILKEILADKHLQSNRCDSFYV